MGKRGGDRMGWLVGRHERGVRGVSEGELPCACLCVGEGGRVGGG